MDLFGFNSNKKEKALRELEVAQRTYESVGKKGDKAIRELFLQRKAALKEIEIVEDILKRQSDFKIQYIKRIADARASIRLFTEAVQMESSIITKDKLESWGDYSTIIGLSSSLVSTALVTSAAVFRLPVGAVIGSSAFLRMAGPIGLAIGSMFAGISIRREKKIIKEANKMKEDIENNTQKIKRVICNINQLSNEISYDVSKLSDLRSMPADVRSAHYEEIVEYVEKLCKKINKRFSL